MLTKEGERAKMTFQMANVNKALASVRRICEAGKRVVFDEDGSYIENKATGKKTEMQKQNGVYVIKVKMPKSAQVSSVGEDHAGEEGSGTSSSSGFARLVTLI